MMTPSFKPVGDYGVLVEFALVESVLVNQMVIALSQKLTQNPPTGVLEITPALVNLLIDFDPLVTDHLAIEQAVRNVLPLETTHPKHTKTHIIDVCYDPVLAPDLHAVATACNMTPAQVITHHTSHDLYVSLYGFAPGYAYLSGVSADIHVPRKPAAVRDVLAGSVIIAGGQCLITTLTMPTGWSVIGRTQTQVLRDDPDRPFLFDVGDTIGFRAISYAKFSA